MLQNVQLYYLIQIDHYQSLSQAAEELHVSQPAISNAIKRLETQLGVKLLNRSNKGVSLTKEGSIAAEKARQILKQMDELEKMFLPKERENFLLDDIIIYANPILSPLLLSLLSKDYKQSNAKHALQIFNITPESKDNKIIAHSTSTVILTILPENMLLPSNVETTLLGKSKAYIMCASGFPFFSPEQKDVSIKDLLSVPLIINKTQFLFQKTLLSLLEQHGTPNIKIVAPDSNSITKTVECGGVACFANKFIQPLQNDQLRYLAIKNSPTFQLCLLHNKNINPLILEQLTTLIHPLLY